MAPLLLATPALAGSIAQQVGLTALIKRVGLGNQPTGAGIAVGQAEADETSPPPPPDPPGPVNAYPNPGDPAFSGKLFVPMSGALATSNHATTVGQNLYGLNSIAPDIDTIYTYEAGNWLLSGHLHTSAGSGTLPDDPPAGVRIFNNSWVGTFGSSMLDNDGLRRADLIVDRDDVMVVSGVQNGPAQQPLMTYMYNGISVGLSAGGHTSGPTPGTHDGPGRMKPEIVAPSPVTPPATSYATAVVSAAVALMFETAQAISGVLPAPNAERSETIKATLLAGANHRAGWSNNPVTSGALRGITSTPLDPVWGVDVVNVNNSHRILTGMEQEGAAAAPASPNINSAGWDLTSVDANASEWYRFRLNGVANAVSILATWHRAVPNDFGVGSVANFDLFLYRVGAAGLQSLVGDAGLPYFASGNVVSQSSVDNLEHLFVRNLQAGQYVIELRRVDELGGLPRDVAIGWIMPNIPRPADLNGDGVVGVADLLALISAWGICPSCPADLNNDGVVSVGDLLMLIADWGP